VTHKERVMDLLSDERPHTHLELYDLHVVAHSVVAALRKDGASIHCWSETKNGKRLYMYQFLSPETLAEIRRVSEEPLPWEAS
jgi:hypothetical protein